jgi:peptidoglycan/LPS O-acetylase OafA/YrhL
MDPVNSLPFAQIKGDCQLGHRRWLDGLRGVAILLVLAFHLGLVPGGSLGVDVFFVLSGFLITTLLVEEWQRRGSISLKNFYLRRVLRLWPAFFTLLGICGLGALAQPSGKEAAEHRREILVAACYVTNWPSLHQTSMPILGHTWSLSVEEQFYIAWPLALWLMLRLNLSRRRIILLVCMGILASALLRLTLYRLSHALGQDKAATVMRLYMGTDTRADALLAGCLVGLLFCGNLLPRSPGFLFWSGAASLVATAGLAFLAWRRCLDHSQYYHGLFTAVALMVGTLIARLLTGPSRLAAFALESVPLVAVGRISYGLYLYHVPIIHWLRPPELGWHYPAATLLAAFLTFATAGLSYFCIERPCLQLKGRFRQSAPAKAPWVRRAPAADGNRGVYSKAI